MVLIVLFMLGGSVMAAIGEETPKIARKLNARYANYKKLKAWKEYRRRYGRA